MFIVTINVFSHFQWQGYVMSFEVVLFDVLDYFESKPHWKTKKCTLGSYIRSSTFHMICFNYGHPKKSLKYMLQIEC